MQDINTFTWRLVRLSFEAIKSAPEMHFSDHVDVAGVINYHAADCFSSRILGANSPGCQHNDIWF